MRSYHDTDYGMISSWQTNRGEIPPRQELLPPTGIIVDNVACGFLIHCDNGAGILDFFISNPEMKDQSKAVLDDIAHALILTAKRAGLKQIYCNTQIKGVMALAQKHSFTYLGEFHSFMREL